MIGTKISLNKAEQYLAKCLSAARHTVNRANNIRNSKIGDQSDEETDLEGISGEIAFCKLFNIYPDTEVKVTSALKGQDQGDAKLPNGLIVDVKTTKYKTGKLIVAPWKNGEGIDYYVLMIGTFPDYMYAGCISRKEFMKEKFHKPFNGRTIFVAEQSDLTDDL